MREVGIDLFGEPVKVSEANRKPTQARGYADFPGTGPEGETCGSCIHKIGGRYLKCDLYPRHTRGPGTDIKARTAACRKWEKREL